MFVAGVEGEKCDVLPPGERIPENNYKVEGVDSYYHQGSFQPQQCQDPAQYYSGSQGDGHRRHSPQSSFSSPSEHAHSAAAPQPVAAPAPARKQPSQRQRSGNLSMLQVGDSRSLYLVCRLTHRSHACAVLHRLAGLTNSILQVPPTFAEKYVNLLVVGESGLGKTTFIRNCFSDFLHEEFELSDASWGSMTKFKNSPSAFCTHLPAIEVPEALIRLRYSVQDVPGCVSASISCVCS